MLRKMIVATSCMLALATGAFAEKLTKTPVDFEIYGTLKSTYKQQTNWRASLLDSKDRFEAAGIEGEGSDLRHGANNRSSQNVRTKGEMLMVARAGENEYEGTPWHNMIGVMVLTLDPKDPDSSLKSDGAMIDRVETGDVWIRYSPMVALGIKVGVQTVAGTAPAALIGHRFAGDPDDDFIFYTASVVDQKPGVTLDFHLSKDIEFGVGQLQGMGDFSSIITGGDSEQAKNNVAWFKGNFGLVEAQVGYQSIKVGEKETVDGVPDTWKHEYGHTLLNYTLKVNVGGFSPFYSVQTASGEKVSENPFATLNTSLSDAGYPTINNNTSGRDVEMTLTTVGIVADLGDFGKVAADYTKVGDAKWGEEKTVWLATEADYITHFNWIYEITESSTVTFFYNFLASRDSDDLRADIQTMQNTVAAAEALELHKGDADQQAIYKSLLGAKVLLESIPMTYDQSIGLELTMKFGN